MRPTALLGILTGLCTLSLCHTRQYHVVYDQMNWTDAQRYCRARFTDLATVGSPQDVNTVNHTVVDYYNPEDRYAAWIGLHDDIDSWRWSLADQQDHGFKKWAPGEPNNLGFWERECCTIMYSRDGSWNDDTCADRLCAICFDDTEPIEKYIFINKSLTWHEAQAHCRERYTDLASVRNQTENEKVRKMIHSDWCWIGLYRDSWKWSDGSSYAFGDWIPGEPSNGKEENCVSMVFGTQGSKWEASKCDETRPFICHSNVPEPEVSVKKQVVRIKVTRNSSLDLNSPAVKEAILEQLKQSMMEEGGETADIKLKWVEQSDGKVFHKDKKKRKKRERKPRLTKMEL